MTYTIHETTHRNARCWCVLDAEGRPVNGQYHPTPEMAQRQKQIIEATHRGMANQRRAG